MLIPDQTSSAKTLRHKVARVTPKPADAKKSQWKAVTSPSVTRWATAKTTTSPQTTRNASPFKLTPERKPLSDLPITPNKRESLRLRESSVIWPIPPSVQSSTRHRRAGATAVRPPVSKISADIKSNGKAELWTPKIRSTGDTTSSSGGHLWNNKSVKHQHPDITDTAVQWPPPVANNIREKGQPALKLPDSASSDLGTREPDSTPSKKALNWLDREKWLAKWKEHPEGETEVAPRSTKPKFRLQRSRREIFNSDPIPETTTPHVESLRVRARQFVEETLKNDGVFEQNDTAEATDIQRNDRPREHTKDENFQGMIRTPKVIKTHALHELRVGDPLCRLRFLAGVSVHDPHGEYCGMESAYVKALRKLSALKIWGHKRNALSNTPNDVELRQLFMAAHDEIQERHASTTNVAPGVVKVVQQVEREQIFLRNCYMRASLQITAQLNETTEKKIPHPPGIISQLREIDPALTIIYRPLNLPGPYKRRNIKSVRWDPAIVEAGPILERYQSSIKVSTLISETPKSTSIPITHEKEAIKDWKMSDRKKIDELMKALRELNTSDGQGMPEKKESKKTTNLNPCVPEFKPWPKPTGIKENQIAVGSEMLPWRKAIWVQVGTAPAQTNLASTRQHLGPKTVVLDDPRSHGREVDRFESWYGDLQIAEFLKRYPMTGKTQGGNGSLGVRIKWPRRRIRQIQRDPAIMSDAAAVQRELEILLYETKERKAFEAMRGRSRENRIWGK